MARMVGSMLVALALVAGVAAEECAGMNGATDMADYGWSCEEKTSLQTRLQAEAEADMPAPSAAWKDAADRARTRKACVFCDVPLDEIVVNDPFCASFYTADSVHNHAGALNSWPMYTMLASAISLAEDANSYSGFNMSPFHYGEAHTDDYGDALCDVGGGLSGYDDELFVALMDFCGDGPVVDTIVQNSDFFSPALVGMAQAAQVSPGMSINDFIAGMADSPQSCAAAMDDVAFEQPKGWNWEASKESVLCAAHPCNFDEGSADLEACFSAAVAIAPPTAPAGPSMVKCSAAGRQYMAEYFYGTPWDFIVDEFCYFGMILDFNADASYADGDIDAMYSACITEESGECGAADCEAHQYGDNCQDCESVEHARNGAEYSCTSAFDTTIVAGGCDDGYFLQAQPGGADTCVACRAIEHCDEPICTSGSDSVCTDCSSGHFGQQCQHAEGVCNSGTPHHDADTDEVSCACDAGFSGDRCEDAAACDAYTPEHPVTVTSGCHSDGELGKSACLLGCADGFYVVGLHEGICAAHDGGAEYDSMQAQCQPCSAIENCEGEVTCSNADDSKCDRCAEGTTGATCRACPAGHQPSGDGCSKCEEGQYSAGGGASCSPCAAGTHAGFKGASSCAPCQPGHFADAAGASTCAACPAGKTALTTGASSCESCGAGETAGPRGCQSCGGVYKCEGEVTCSEEGDAQCAEDGCAKGFHIVNGFKCQKCTHLPGCIEGNTECTGSTDAKCSQCEAGMYIDHKGHCARCEKVNRCVAGQTTCTMGPPTGDSDAVCNKCRANWEGEQCDVRVPDMTCLVKGHFDGDGTDSPDNTSRTAEDFQQCQWMCQKQKGKKINLSEMAPGEKVAPKYLIGGCAVFSYNVMTKECRLQAADAGKSPCPEEDVAGGDAPCREESLKRVLGEDWSSEVTLHGEWLAGPKYCYKATCDTLECPDGYDVDKEHMYRLGSRLKCHSATCSVERDLHTCCNPAKCGTWTCPKHFVAKFGADDTACADHNGVAMCTAEADTDTCCDPNAMCDTLDCGVGWEHMREGIHVSKKPCAGPVCSIEADRLTCCDPLAECARDFECPVNRKSVVKTETGQEVRFVDYVANPALDNPTYCHARFCEESHDLQTCCVQRADCSSYECPDGYAFNAYAIKTQIACKGAECTREDDLDTCCFRKVHCGTMQSTGDGDICPSGYSPKDDLDSILCASNAGRCDPRVDTDTCCNAKETCDEMQRELFDCAGVNLQFGDDCDIKCMKKKCQAQPTCAWAVGPPDWWLPLGPIGYEDVDHQKVGSGACGYAECHREWGGCVCPSGKDEWDEDEQMEGAFFKPGTGATAVSDWGFKLSEDAFESDCVWHTESVCVDSADFTERDADGKATSVLSGKKDCTPKRTAPMMSGSDTSDKCPDDYISIAHGDRVHCAGPFCTEGDDRDTCCTRRASCDTMLGHPDHHALKSNAAELLCHGVVCTAVDVTRADGVVIKSDIETCTDARGSCADLTCGAGTMNRGSSFLCASGSCEDSDQATCCVACAVGTFSANGEDCADCAEGKFSSEGYGDTGSASCTDCGDGKYSDAGMDHCLDCAPIFGCYSKGGMAYDDATGRRRLAMSAIALPMALSCNGDATSTCDKCVDGYFLTNGATECKKCNKVKNCKGTHHCTSAADHTCGEGECVAGHFGPACASCPAEGHELCASDGLTCDHNGQNTKCTKCSPGSYLDSFAMCSLCVQEPNCEIAQCSGPGDHTCTKCFPGYFPSGQGCGQLYFDDYRGVWAVDDNTLQLDEVRRVTAKVLSFKKSL